MNVRFLVAALALSACSPVPSEVDQLESGMGPGGDIDGKADSTGRMGYYQARHDTRKCVSPLCGGWYIHRVNVVSTKCADGKYAAECYVADIDLTSAGLSADLSTAVVRGSLKQVVFGNFGKLGTFTVSEAWQAASTENAEGIFYRVTDNDIRCITAPCASQTEAKLNSSSSTRNIAGVTFDAVTATDDQIADAWDAISSSDGLLAAGENVGSRPASLAATQFYIRVQPKPTKTCHIGGCSSQICSDKSGVVSTCIWKPEYACYQKYGVCEVQSDGDCGWTQSAALLACLP